jgi:rare lipoprotein A
MPRETLPLLATASLSITVWQRALPLLTAGTAILVVCAADVPTADAKSPGSRYCFHGYCHRVGSLAQTDTLVGWRGYVQASYYDSCHRDRLNPCGLTSSGAVFRADLPDNAASPLLPDGTIILAYNPKTNDASVLRITNAGPYSGERKLDVSRAAADKLGFRSQGVAGLVISVLQSPTKAEANYAKRRVYPLVPGYLGKFETVDAAIETAQVRFDLRESEQLADDGPETVALENELIPRPQLAVSPSLARELVILRSPPRPAAPGPRLVQGPRLASRDGQLASEDDVQLVQGPRPVSRADFMAQQPVAETATPPEAGAPAGFTSRLLRYLLPSSAPADAAN